MPMFAFHHIYASVNSKRQHPSSQANPRGIFLRWSKALHRGKIFLQKHGPRAQGNTYPRQYFERSSQLFPLIGVENFRILQKSNLKGQLQRFHKLISNNRIWPSEHGFEVIFEKSLFVFEISAFKVRNKRGIHSRFHSFSENNNRETLVCHVTSDQSSMISTERSDLRDCKASGNCYV